MAKKRFIKLKATKDKKGGFEVETIIRGLSVNDVIQVFGSSLEDFEKNAVDAKN
jgi:hypothetical protein